MIIEDEWSWKRFGMLAIMAFATLVMTVAALAFDKAEMFQWLLMAFGGIVFFLLLALSLEWYRREQGVFHEKSHNFKRIASAYVICCGLTVVMSFLPDYGTPVLIIAVVMTMAATPFVGMLTGCYAALILCMVGSGTMPLMFYYLVLGICGCIMAQYLHDSKNVFWSSWMILTVTFCLSIICSVLEYRSFSWKVLLYGIFSGVISSMTVSLLFRLWNDKIENSKVDTLEKIIGEDYELVELMKSYSKMDYQHARKVSRIAAGCARALEVNEPLAAAAGFYYRIGRLEGEPFVENALILGKKHDFPPELLQILGEYNGEKYLPSTVESALVHIVDNVVTKFDVLDVATLSSSWNQDIVVYQTLNENSAQGLYDKSGLSMNMYLVVRDYLIKEAGLYDGNH